MNYQSEAVAYSRRGFEPNKDIISGQGNRLKKQSGVNILAPPFNFKIKVKIAGVILL